MIFPSMEYTGNFSGNCSFPFLGMEGNTRFVAARDAMQHLERNFMTFQKIFVEFNVPESEYLLLAGFDEDLIRQRLGFLNQIHVLLRAEPRDMDLFLFQLSQVLGSFTAVIFTDKATYRLPSAPELFHEIVVANTSPTAYGFSTLSKDADIGGSFNIGGSSGQGNNGRDRDEPDRKGKARDSEEPPIPPDFNNEGNSDPKTGDAPESAELSFHLSTDLLQHGVPFQKLEVEGALKIKRTPESQDPSRFATCIFEFTEIHTTNRSVGPANPKYHHFQLDVRVESKDDAFVIVSKARPMSTPKFHSESKISNGSKKTWSLGASANLAFLPVKATIASGSRGGEQSTNTERIVNVSRIIFTNIEGVSEWTYHLVDEFEQDSGFTLSPEKLPFAHILFGGHRENPPPPSAFLNVEISTYWTILSPPSGSTWPEGSSGNKPMFSNLCKIMALDLPNDLQGSHLYVARLLALLDTSPVISSVESGIQYLGKAVVAETNHRPLPI